jgi:Zn-dependent protease
MSSLDFGLAIFELVVMVFALSLHDCAQAWAANRLGDPTARMMGRLSMNPARHFDVLGTGIFPLIYVLRSPPFVIGWTKPVAMTPRNFRRMVRDENMAILAGPAVQLLTAVLALVVLVVIRHVNGAAALSLETAARLAMHYPGVDTVDLPTIFPFMLFLYYCILINLLLFVFNLVPFPFFDGGKILVNYLPYNAAQTFQRASMYFMIGFFFFGFGVVMLFFRPLMALFNGLLGV